MRKLFSMRNALLVVMLALTSMPVWAQRNIRTVLFVRVRLDQTDAWKSAAKDLSALFKKAGVEQPYTIWESQTGPARYAVVWYSANWKEVGEDDPKLKPMQAEMGAIFKRLNASTITTETWIDEIQPDMLIRGNSMPPYVRTARVRIVSGKMDEAKALFRDSLFPAQKKAGTADFGVAVSRFGTPGNELHTYASVNGWGDFDSPVGAQKGMSADEWKTFQSKLNGVVEGGVEFDLWKFQPDLSYVPAAPK